MRSISGFFICVVKEYVESKLFTRCFTDWLTQRLEEELPFMQYLIEDWPRESNNLLSYLEYADERLHCKGSDTWDIICFLWATYAYESLEKLVEK